MEQLTSNNWLLILAVGATVVALIVWLVYRNLKDEKKLEENMNDPKRDFHKVDEENEV
jgi:uncharacterized membrane-anchored protein YhcB (DUF1043 family)